MVTNAWFITGGTALYAGHDFAASVLATTLTPLVPLRFVASFRPVAGAAVFLVGTLVVLCAVAIAMWLLLSEAVPAAGRPSPQSAPGPVPVRSPRTSIILAELARQRRLERQQRRLKRGQRRQAWAQVAARLGALGRSIRFTRKPSPSGRSPRSCRSTAAWDQPVWCKGFHANRTP